jgi:hypothetical protein
MGLQNGTIVWKLIVGFQSADKRDANYAADFEISEAIAHI